MKYTIDTHQIAESVDKAFAQAETSLNAAFKKADKVWEECWNILEHPDFPFHSLHSVTNGARNFPPYNIIEQPDGKVRLEMAVAGYSKDRLNVELEGNILIVKGIAVKLEPKTKTEQDFDALHPAQEALRWKGISNSSFLRTFEMSTKTIVESVTLRDGLLTVLISTVKPEPVSKTTFEIK